MRRQMLFLFTEQARTIPRPFKPAVADHFMSVLVKVRPATTDGSPNPSVKLNFSAIRQHFLPNGLEDFLAIMIAKLPFAIREQLSPKLDIPTRNCRASRTTVAWLLPIVFGHKEPPSKSLCKRYGSCFLPERFLLLSKNQEPTIEVIKRNDLVNLFRFQLDYNGRNRLKVILHLL